MAVAFAALFLLVAVLRDRWSFWLGVVSAGFAIAGLLFPSALRPLNRAWLWLGLALHRVVNPVVLMVLFFCVTLIGLAWRAVKRDPLRLAFDPRAKSYWVERKAGEPDPKNFPYQF